MHIYTQMQPPAAVKVKPNWEATASLNTVGTQGGRCKNSEDYCLMPGFDRAPSLTTVLCQLLKQHYKTCIRTVEEKAR